MIRFYVFILAGTCFNCRYLGIILNFNLCDSLDMVRATGALNRSFGFLFRKFNSLSIDVFYRLFLIHCTSFYASELWFDRYKCRHHFIKAAVSYHYSLNKILGIPKYFRNHFICDVFNAFVFEHFINFKYINFLFWLVKCRSFFLQSTDIISTILDY